MTNRPNPAPSAADPRLAKALAHLKAGESKKALKAIQACLKTQPKAPLNHALYGDILRQMGDTAKAEKAYKQALALQPKLPAARLGRGLLRLGRGEFPGAIRVLSDLAEDLPAGRMKAAVLGHLSTAYMTIGERGKAAFVLMQALDLAPEQDEIWHRLARALGHADIELQHPKARFYLGQLLDRKDVNPRPIAPAIAKRLKRDHDISSAPQNLLEDGLYLAFLAAAPITDVELEIATTRLRKSSLKAFVEGAALTATQTALPFLIALAQQCFVNEYAFFVSEEEEDALSGLKTRVEKGEPEAIALLAAYQALTPSEMPLAGWPGSLSPIVTQQIENPKDEQDRAKSVPQLRRVEDATSLNVQNMYAENPYPRWTQCDRAEPQDFQAVILGQLPHLNPKEVPDRREPDILIAGCGTGLQTMKVVSSYKNASVTAIDISLPSIAYGLRKLSEYGVTSVEHLQADILDLDLMSEQFGLVESFGVIHHMAEPADALQKLSDRLKPGGILFLGLYSELGRQSVVEARELIESQGYPSTPGGIREARRHIRTLDDPRYAPLLSPASDFWTLSDTRDLIFHVQEHRFSLLQIEDMLAGVGLDFLGLTLQNAADRQLFLLENTSPDAPRSLEAWHKFETRHPEIFGDTYRIWAKKPAP